MTRLSTQEFERNVEFPKAIGNSIHATCKTAAMEIHRKLILLCDARGWDQATLNREAGEPVSKGTLSNYFAGKSRPSLEAALAFARALNVSLDWLADDSKELPPGPAADGVRVEAEDVQILEMVQILGRERAKRRLMGVFSPEDVRQSQSD